MAHCPRCGYDLSGHIASWGASCTLAGQCSECGLEYAWSDLLDPRRRVQPWLFEHARSRRVRSALSTINRTTLPWRFWSEVRLHHEVRIGRLIALVAGVGVASQVLLSVLAGGLALAASEMWWRVRAMVAPTARDALLPSVCPQFDFRWAGKVYPMVSDWTVLVVLWWLLPMLLFLILGDTLRMARVRWGHLVRIGAYSLVPALLLIQFDVALRWLQEYGGAVRAAQRSFGGSAGFPAVDASAVRSLWGFALAAYGLWLGAWWCYAIRTYMRLPRPMVVFVVMHGTAMFAASVLFLGYEVWVVY